MSKVDSLTAFYERCFILFPTIKNDSLCCTLRQATITCLIISFVCWTVAFLFSLATLISPFSMGEEYEELFYGYPDYMYPQIVVFFLLNTLEVIACVLLFFGIFSKMKGRRLLCIRISLFISVPVFILSVIYCIFNFVFEVYIRYWTAIELVAVAICDVCWFVYIYCNIMVVKSYFILEVKNDNELEIPSTPGRRSTYQSSMG